jgi:hypothetical protein
MSFERGTNAAELIVRPMQARLLGVLVLAILRLVILLGWRDGGRARD